MTLAKKLTLIVFVAGLPTVCIYGGGAVRRVFSSRDSPSAAEAFVAERARDMAISRKARLMKNPFRASP
jgi:hypothetical protein